MGLAYRELVEGVTTLLRAAEPSAAALDELVNLGLRCLDVPGMGVVEIDSIRNSGRTVAAVGAAAWSLGRPIQVEPTVLLQPGPIYRVEPANLSEQASDQLRDLGGVLVYRHELEEHDVLLFALFARDAEATEDQLAAMGLLGAALDKLYRTSADLPCGMERPHPGENELFIALTSHELRTPVTVIKAFADTLRDHWEQLDGDERRSYARSIGQRADDLARMVDRLLSASSSAWLAEAQQVPFDLLEALRLAAANLPGGLRRRLRLELPPGLPPALGDRASVGPVLTELVTNADKYADGPDPVILSASCDLRTVIFQVADRGIGIPPDQTHRAFERFWQGDTGDDRRYGGAGLGLFLVRKTIERQNGWVSLRPRDGGGTVAEVRLPRGDVK